MLFLSISISLDSKQKSPPPQQSKTLTLGERMHRGGLQKPIEGHM